MHGSSDPQFLTLTTGIQPGPDALTKSRFIMTFITILGVTKILWSFRLVLKGTAGKGIPESSRLEFLETILVHNFALSYAEYSTSGPLNRGGITDLSLLRTLLAIRIRSQEPSFWELMDSIVLLLTYANLTASKTFLLACLNVTLDSEELFCWYKRKK